MVSRFYYRFSFVLCLLAALCLPLAAQTSFGRISGTITDPSGAAISGAKVTITNVDTQAKRDVTTDSNGFYVATNLAIGTYTVEINQEGFQRQQRTGLQLVADGRLTANFKLQVGNVSQSIEVVATQGETLNTVSGEVSHVIDTKQVNNLALNGRTYTQLMTLVPGAIVTNPDQFSTTTSLSATNQTINGNRSDSNNLTVDGAFNLVAGSNGSLMNNVSPDFIQEVKVQTSNFSAEYGRASGPAFNVVTKNGTNEFHGAAFEYFRNDVLDARNFFSPQKTPLRFNDFGYDLGGPIKKDKLFFFVGEEWKRLRQNAQPTRVTVPSSAELAGNFAGQKQLIDPVTKQAIPGNNISSMITPDGRAIGNVYALMSSQATTFNDAAVSNNATLEPSNPLNYREDIVRLDYRINDTNTVYGRWIQDYNSLIDPFGTFSGSNLPTTPTVRNRPGESFLVAETWLPTPHIVNEVRANASWASQHIPPYGNTWERSTYGFQFPQLYGGGQYDNGIPNVGITGISNFKGPAFALMSPTTDIQFSDTISFVLGNHILKAGFVYIRDRVDQNGRPPYTGDISFNASGNPNTTGNALADALLGNFRTYSEASADPVGFFRFSQPEAFVQDSWKVSSKLSLELGVRYQFMQPMYTQANNMANFVPALYDPAQAVTMTTGGTVVPGSGNLYNGLIRAGNGVPTDQEGRVPGSTTPFFQSIPAGAPRGLSDSANLFAPRVGFAYSADSKTVIRGGYGIFYNRPQGNLTFSQVNLPPILLTSERDNGNLSNPAGGTPGASPIAGISAINPDLKFSYNQQFSFGVQRQLPKGMFLETTYVGNLGRRLLRQPNINFPDLALVAANPKINTNYFNPYAGYTSIRQYLSDATSNYHALQVFVSKRTGAVTMTAGYTWSKSLADASGEGDNPDDYLNRHFNYGPSSYDRRHAFFGTFVWQTPMLRDRNAFVRSTAGGWQVSGIIRLQSGPYSSVTGATAEGTRRADYISGPVLVQSGRSIDNWINTDAFATAPDGRWGTSGAGIVEAPGLQSYDLSLAKRFALTERFRLRLQGDFFNAFNIANFTGLNTTATSAAFGTLNSAYPPRNIQLGMKLEF